MAMLQPTQTEPLLHSNGKLLALPVNTRVGRKGLRVTNTLAYYNIEIITAVKNIDQVPGTCTIKHYGSLMFGKWTGFVIS
jgi:hypothetical protein